MGNRYMKHINISKCVCPSCGSVMYVPRRSGRAREKLHQKNLWCYRCKQEQTMTEYRDNDIYMNALCEKII